MNKIHYQSIWRMIIVFHKKNQSFELNEMIQSCFSQIEKVEKENQEKSKKFEQHSEEILKKIRNNQNDFQ